MNSIHRLGSQLIFLLIVIVAFNDIFAYFGGKKFGKTPLAKKISPNKTIEGSLCGIIGGILLGYGALYLLNIGSTKISILETTITLSSLLNGWHFILICLVVIPAAQIGDLVESKFKRKFEIKDTGLLIPGHGGLLDRVDAYLIAIPIFTICLFCLNFIKI